MPDFIEALNLNEPLSNTGYTKEEVLNLLHDHNSDFVKAAGNRKVKSLSAKDISEEKGFLSRVFRITIEFVSSERTYSCMLKIPTYDHLESFHKKMDYPPEKHNSSRPFVLNMHNTECRAYELIKEIQGCEEFTDRRVFSFPTAKCYHIQIANESEARPGLLMMQDLSDNGRSMQVFESASAEHCREVARHFAVFQAHMNLKTDQKWRGKFTQCFHVGSAPSHWPVLFQQAMIYDPTKKPLLNAFLQMDFQKLGIYTLVTKPVEYNALTLAHGDAWSGNMLFNMNEDGSISNRVRAYIDWQTMFESNPLLDLTRFMVNCSDAEIRREIEYETVDLYYTLLQEEYKKHGAKPAFSCNQAHELYEHALVQEAVVMVFMFTLCALPLIETKTGQAKAAKFWLRLCFALEDAVPLIDKHDLIAKCKK